MAKFRIAFSDVIVIKDVNGAPRETTRLWFDGLIRNSGRHAELPG